MTRTTKRVYDHIDAVRADSVLAQLRDVKQQLERIGRN